jgi:hypothetical protein
MVVRRPCKFRQREITRTIRAARAAGLAVDRVEVNSDGRIVVHFGNGDDSPKKLNTADAVLEELKNGGKKL